MARDQSDLSANEATRHVPTVYVGAAAAERFVELLTGIPDAAMHWRVIADPPDAEDARKLEPGPILARIEEMRNYQDQGFGVFVVVNAGGSCGSQITDIRAVFIDADGRRLPERWHVQPHFIVIRDETHWHAYWLVGGVTVSQFTALQKRLISRYDSDPVVCDLARVMRVPGFKHLKTPNNPIEVRLEDWTGRDRDWWQLPLSLEQVTNGLPELKNKDGTPVRQCRPDLALDLPVNVEHARKVLRSWTDAEPGEGNGWAYKAAQRAMDFGLSPEMAIEVVAERDAFNPSPRDPDELETIVQNAFQYRQNDIGCDAQDPASKTAAAQSANPAVEYFNRAVAKITSEGDAHMLEGGGGLWCEAPDSEPIPFWIAVLNAAFAAVSHNGRIQIAGRKPDGRIEWLEFAEFARPTATSLSPPYETSDHLTAMGTAWTNSKLRRQYLKGTVFQPGVPQEDMPPGVFNLWTGWPFDTTQRGAGDWSRLKAHIRDVVCAGNEALAKWFMGWMAWCVQNLDRPPGVTPILTGVQGCGKTFVFEAFGRLFGAHFLQMNDPARLTQQFNEHLETALFCLADEALFAGDKKQAARMKALITDRNFTAEHKGGATGVVKNHMRMAMTTNEAHAADFERTNRRYIAIAVNPDYARNVCGDTAARTYFNAITEELEAGGYQAMLYDLLHEDLAGFDVEALPRTEETVEQKLASLRSFDRWAYERAYAGEMSDFSSEDWSAGSIFAPKAAVYEKYKAQCTEQREYQPATEAQFAKALQKLLGSELRQQRSRHGPTRRQDWVFPPLAEFRAAFERHIGEPGRIPWPD